MTTSHRVIPLNASAIEAVARRLEGADLQRSANGNGDGDSSRGKEEAPDEGGIDTLVEVSDELTSQSAVERVSASR